MNQYPIPPEILTNIKQIGAIDTLAFRMLVDDVEQQLQVSLSIEDELRELVLKAPSLGDESVEKRLALAEAMAGVHYMRLHPRQDDDDLLSALDEACTAQSFDTDLAKTLAANVRLVLGIKVLRASIKAWSLVADNERTYLASRIVTDCRPVFDDDFEESFLASLIIHSLKVTMRLDGKTHSVFVTADSNDLRELRDGIDRALAKASRLSNQISSIPNMAFGPPLEAAPNENKTL